MSNITASKSDKFIFNQNNFYDSVFIRTFIIRRSLTSSIVRI
jgi:hypothetical protein